uniref:Clone ZZD603 mRNA sequence n=1 Tax=Schistosoma japonicum TaxID=6182 RepID=Q86EB4_SCHJA|nr:hypothetical protein [Schistosoma japonicum]
MDESMILVDHSSSLPHLYQHHPHTMNHLHHPQIPSQTTSQHSRLQQAPMHLSTDTLHLLVSMTSNPLPEQSNLQAPANLSTSAYQDSQGVRIWDREPTTAHPISLHCSQPASMSTPHH